MLNSIPQATSNIVLENLAVHPTLPHTVNHVSTGPPHPASFYLFFVPLTRQVSQEQILIFNDGLPRPNPDDAGPIVCRPMGLPNHGWM